MKRLSAFAVGMALSAMAITEAEAQGADADNKTANSNPAGRLFERHCRECHAGDKHKGDFRIESLSLDFADKPNRAMWLAVLERLEEGDMPPKKEPRPEAQALQAAVDWIHQRAGSAEIARRAAEGRVVLRRLNRAEYANTVRDLLHVEVDLTDLLPPDTSTSGFDNNAEALHTSSYLLRNYLAAADRALDAAIANDRKPWLLNRVFDIKKERSVAATGSVYRHIDDGVAIFASWESANIRVTMWNFRSHVRGKYRFRISGYGYQSDSKPVDFHVTAGTLKEVTEERLIDYYSFPADKPTVLEFTEQLEPENRIRIIADGLPALPPAVEKIGADKYTGPGLVIQWVEIVGPLLESWPPPSHKSIFGDMPQARVPGASDPDRMEVVSRQPNADAERILRNFARRAFRRAVTDEEIRPFLSRVTSRLQDGYSFEQAVRVGLKGIMVSPDFLFLREKTNIADSSGSSTGSRLSDDALASRLFLFSMEIDA